MALKSKDPVEAAPHASRGARVLLVDDHIMVREVLHTIVNGYSGLSVVGEAVNGLGAIAVAAAIKPDVILMDVNMPMMNGIEATKHIKAAQPAIIVIGLSINNCSEVVERMKEAGADAFLSKETAADQLYDLILQSTHD
jgi:DNA-binding NarL/FixJ family response regulator